MKTGSKRPTRIILKADDYLFELSPRGRGMLFNIRTGEVLTVNKTGAFLLELLRAGTDWPSIVLRFTTRYSLSRGSAESDIREFFAELRNLDILEGTTEP